MTKIRELIQNSTFTTAPGFENLEPELSFFLPTYKRGDNGLFEGVLKSFADKVAFAFDDNVFKKDDLKNSRQEFSNFTNAFIGH